MVGKEDLGAKRCVGISPARKVPIDARGFHIENPGLYDLCPFPLLPPFPTFEHLLAHLLFRMCFSNKTTVPTEL